MDLSNVEAQHYEFMDKNGGLLTLDSEEALLDVAVPRPSPNHKAVYKVKIQWYPMFQCDFTDGMITAYEFIRWISPRGLRTVVQGNRRSPL